MPMTLVDWFRAFDTFAPKKDLALLKEGVAAGHRDAQDEWGMTALHLCVASGWVEGMRALLAAGAATELRYHRTGETALYTAVQEKSEPAVRALLEAGADADGANYWGKTAREWASSKGLEHLFASIPKKAVTMPAPRIQNAEHLADHYHPKFKIPKRAERESLGVGQAVDVHVHGPKKPAVKVRIRERRGQGAATVYLAHLDPADQDTNLPAGTAQVTFGPEHVATVYLQRP
jgi:hypothetical protein